MFIQNDFCNGYKTLNFCHLIILRRFKFLYIFCNKIIFSKTSFFALFFGLENNELCVSTICEFCLCYIINSVKPRPHSCIHRQRLEFVRYTVYRWAIQCIFLSLKYSVQSWLLIETISENENSFFCLFVEETKLKENFRRRHLPLESTRCVSIFSLISLFVRLPPEDIIFCHHRLNSLYVRLLVGFPFAKQLWFWTLFAYLNNPDLVSLLCHPLVPLMTSVLILTRANLANVFGRCPRLIEAFPRINRIVSR